MRLLLLLAICLTASCAQTNSLRPFPTDRLAHLVGTPYGDLLSRLGEPHRLIKVDGKIIAGWYANYGGPWSTPAVMQNQNCQFFFKIGSDDAVESVDMAGDSITCDRFIDSNRKQFGIEK